MQRFLAAALAAITLAACDGRSPTDANTARAAGGIDAARVAAAAAAPTVIVSGLEYPRGFTFRDGVIYVAEAGTPEGNERTTVGQCQQVPPPVGPWHGGFTGRVSRVTMAGKRTTVADHLPSARNNVGDVDGIADVAFLDKKMYVLSSAGCSRGHPQEPSSVLRMKENGRYEREANLSRWIMNHPTAHPNAGDYEPDGDWYNMARRGDLLYLVESNQGNLVAVDPDGGKIKRVADVSETENGHVVPSGLSVSRTDDDVYVGELTPFPSVPGSANVIVYEPNGKVEDRLRGFTAVLGVANDRIGNVYVLESFNCAEATPCFPSAGSGKVIRVARDGTRTIVAAGLSFPTGLRLGPDGALYVSNFSFGPPHMGQILRITP